MALKWAWLVPSGRAESQESSSVWLWLPGAILFPAFLQMECQVRPGVLLLCHCETDCFETQWLKTLLTIFRARNLAHGGQHRRLQWQATAGWPAGLNGAVCLGLSSGCQRLQFFPQQACWGCKTPDATFPHQVCHLGWLSRHSWGQRASLSPSHPSHGFLGFLAARQTRNSGLPQRGSYERQEEGAAWAQKPVQHHLCHLLPVNAAWDCPQPDSKG